MKMNYVDALTLAIDTLSTSTDDTIQKAVEKLSAIRTTYTNRAEKRPVMSDEKKAELSAARKAKTAAARAEFTAQVIPVLRKHLSTPLTAKEVFEAAKSELPADCTWNKVQNVLIREMAPELVKTEKKGEPNHYVLK